MMSDIEGGRVCACKAMLYKTAVVSAELAEGLPKDARFVGIEAGAVVAVQFAYRLAGGQPAFYFGRAAGAWLGVSAASGFSDFVL